MVLHVCMIYIKKSLDKYGSEDALKGDDGNITAIYTRALGFCQHTNV